VKSTFGSGNLGTSDCESNTRPDFELDISIEELAETDWLLFAGTSEEEVAISFEPCTTFEVCGSMEESVLWGKLSGHPFRTGSSAIDFEPGANDRVCSTCEQTT